MSDPPALMGLVGSSSAMQKLREQIARYAATRIPVLIVGPTGSGKEVVAQALHAGSGRSGSLVAINVCAIADTLFDDAMFGHVRGAFSGATTDRVGFLLEADRGTIFLDEINGLPLTSQSKLLRALETRLFRPVGARADRTSDFRLISATNSSLSDAVRQGVFREDLSYRVSGATIRVPSLAEHREDIPELVRHFVEEASSERDERVQVSDGATGFLAQQSWPGNVRQLRHVVACAAATTNSLRIDRDDVVQVLELERALAIDDEPFARRRLIDVLQALDWDTGRAAEYFGVHRASIYRRMQRLGIQAQQRRIGKPERANPVVAKGALSDASMTRDASVEQA